MKYKTLLAGIFIFGLQTGLIAQNDTFAFTAHLTIPEELQNSFQSQGRLFLFLCENPDVEPRTQLWPSPWSKTHIFAMNVFKFDLDEGITITDSDKWTKTVEWDLGSIPPVEYNVQILWDQDISESTINAPGNFYSEKLKVLLDTVNTLEISIDQVIEARTILDHPLVREVDIESETLSEWWGRPKRLKASVLLPAGYSEHDSIAYPIRYNVAGYGGRYTRVNHLLSNKDFMDWWESEEAPRVITVFLDGEGPFGDSYQMDSDNSGPYGEALISDLIPYIESRYRGTDSSATRFVDGCSTGGWVSLALQLFYPDFFNGAYSYSPDAVDFENYQLVNIYQDENVFFNEYNYLRPVMRDVSGEPIMAMKDFIAYENVLGSSNSYLNSGGQFSAHAALYSPRGRDELPKPLFDPFTGEIDKEVAEHWKKYDLKIHTQQNWETLGPKLEGKIYIWMGDMDHFYLSPATRSFARFLELVENPASDAEIEFSPMEGHCSKYSNRAVLEKIGERLNPKEKEEE